MADLTDKRRVFIEEYLTCWIGSTAAARAGYKNPRQEASRLLSNDDIRALIEARIADKAMSANEVLLRLADQARSTMDDFLTLRPVRAASMMTKPLADIIADLNAQIAFEDTYADRADLSDKELESHRTQMAAIRRRIVRLQLRLERDPDATEDVPGPMVDQQVPDIDLAKAAARGKLHLVKSYNAKDGKIELYDAHAAQVDIGKHHGLFVDKTEISGPHGGPLVVKQLSGVSTDDV